MAQFFYGPDPLVEDVKLAARSAENQVQSGSADVQSLQHVHAGAPSSLIEDWQLGHNLRLATKTLCQPSTTMTFAKLAF